MGFEREFSLSDAKVQKEQIFAGYGRVDVVIQLRDHLILIENKIDAFDGNRQLKRYDDNGKASGKQWQLWYLIKKGTEAHVSSHCGVSYRRLSYQEHILDWLERCVGTSSATPALQRALIQYKNLVQKNHRASHDPYQTKCTDRTSHCRQFAGCRGHRPGTGPCEGGGIVRLL